ncbi:hypothetical protein ACFY0A_29510 [Streptomyces sp. NPDC001698]|uniref:hypothetical protein n=1 Tax=unclassified Streptomyces TaxID=2593676 RepID=UPI003673B8B7
MGTAHITAARRTLAEAVGRDMPEDRLLDAARAAVVELARPGRLVELVTELASGAGDPAACARHSYRHVLGFRKLLLIDGGHRHRLRAHLWQPGVESAALEDIHNHRSPLASCVVRGRLSMELYEPSRDGGITATRYRESLSEHDAHWQLTALGPARLRSLHTARYAAGSSYALPAHTLHRAWCDTSEPTVTLFLETGGGRSPHTDVFTRSDTRPGTVEKEPLSEDDYLSELSTLAGTFGVGARAA